MRPIILSLVAVGTVCTVSFGQPSTDKGPARFFEEPAAMPDTAAQDPYGQPADGLMDLLQRRVWVTGEYLLWWTRGQNLPPLVTTSAAGTSIDQAGVLGLPGTSVLYGDRNVDNRLRSGARVSLGYWLDDGQTWGIGIGGFVLATGSNGFQATSSGDPILARPFFDASFSTAAAELTADPGIVDGGVTVSTRTRLVGANAFLTKALCCNQECGKGYRVDGLAGFRFLRLSDYLDVEESLIGTSTSPFAAPQGTTFHLHDQFRTDNRFYGGDFGLRFQYYTNRFTFDVLTKLAIGGTNRITTINGSTQIAQPGQAPQTLSGGLLALDTNIGRYSDTVFSWVPEIQLNLGYRITDQLRAFVGYTFLYWSNVQRAGDQVDLRINPNYLPPVVGGDPRLPAFPAHSTGFWAQGINFGLSYNY